MITVNEFNLALRIAVSHAVTTPERAAELPHLQNIFLSFDACDTLRLIGSDGYRLAVAGLAVAHGQPAGTTALLSLADADRLIAACSGGEPTTPLTIMPFGPTILFSAGSACESYPTAPWPADTPNWASILSKMPAVDATADGLRIDAGYLAESLEVCKPVLSEDKPTVRLRVADHTALFILPEVRRSGLTAIAGVTIAIMYKGGM